MLLERRSTQKPLKEKVHKNGSPSRHEAGTHHHPGSREHNHFCGCEYVRGGAVGDKVMVAVSDARDDGTDDVHDEACQGGHIHHAPGTAPAILLAAAGRQIGHLVGAGVFPLTHLGTGGCCWRLLGCTTVDH